MRRCFADPFRPLRNRHGNRVVGQIKSDNRRRGGLDFHLVRSDVLQPVWAGRSCDGRRPATQQEERLGPDVIAPKLPTGYAIKITKIRNASIVIYYY